MPPCYSRNSALRRAEHDGAASHRSQWVLWSTEAIDSKALKIPVGGGLQYDGIRPCGAVLAGAVGHHTVCPERDLLILAIHLLVTFAKLLRPGGVRAVDRVA